jgi:hypothetical protein
MSVASEVATDLVAGPKTAISRPLLFISIGLFFLLLVVIVEVFKPGVITDPIRKAVGMVGIKSSSGAA